MAPPKSSTKNYGRADNIRGFRSELHVFARTPTERAVDFPAPPTLAVDHEAPLQATVLLINFPNVDAAGRTEVSSWLGSRTAVHRQPWAAHSNSIVGLSVSFLLYRSGITPLPPMAHDAFLDPGAVRQGPRSKLSIRSTSPLSWNRRLLRHGR